MIIRIVYAAALAASLGGTALAQQGDEKASFVQAQNAGDWRGTKLIGASVYGPDNSSIGEITDVLIGGDGRIRAVVVGVGGLLDLADKDVAIPFEALIITRGAANGAIDKVTVRYTKDQLKAAPRFAFDQMSSPQTIGADGGPSAPHQ